MRILYGVDGEGMGHAIRSKTIITELEKEHKVRVVAGGRAYDLLNKFFDTSKIDYLKIVYRDNSVNYVLTFFYNIIRFPYVMLYNLRLIRIFLKFRPDIVITDLEPFSCYLAMIFGKKCISIDNQHIINTALKTKYTRIDQLIIRLFTIKADYYLVTTFFYPKVERGNTFLFPPINREEILKAKPKRGDYILVYQTSNSDKRLANALRSVKSRFVIYGFEIEKEVSNLIFKRFDEKSFLKDLVECKAVICNGGFTLIGEALYLKKPVLSIPVKKQIEQIRNAFYLEDLGFGKYCEEINKENVERFISKLGMYDKNLKRYKKEDNFRVLSKLREILEKQKHI